MHRAMRWLGRHNAVDYYLLADGSELNITRGWVGEPTLEYPPEFWNGLGIRETEVGLVAPPK